MANDSVHVDLTASDKQVQEATKRAESILQRYAGRASSILKKLFSGIGGGIVVANQAKELTGSAFGVLQNIASTSFDAEKAQVRLRVALLATGNMSGWTADQLDVMADGLARTSEFARTAILDAEGALAKFTNVREEIFQDALKSSADLAAFWGTSLPDAAKKLGAALNDPAQAMESLAEAGVRFTDQQKRQIEAALARGKLVEAQRMILSGVQDKFGGTAGRMIGGIGGAWEMAMKSVKDAIQAIGHIVSPIIREVATAIENIASKIRSMWKAGQLNGVRDAAAGIFQWVKNAVDYVITAAIKIGAVIGTIWNKWREMIDYVFSWIEWKWEKIKNELMDGLDWIFTKVERWFDQFFGWLRNSAGSIVSWIAAKIKAGIGFGDDPGDLQVQGFQFNPGARPPRTVPPEEAAAQRETERLGKVITDEYERLRKAMMDPYEAFKALLKQPADRSQANPGKPQRERAPLQFSPPSQPHQAQWVGLDEMYKKISASRASTANDPMKQLVDHAKEAKEQRKTAKEQRDDIQKTLREMLRANTRTLNRAAPQGVIPVPTPAPAVFN